jgi:hypothetical protein
MLSAVPLFGEITQLEETKDDVVSWRRRTGREGEPQGLEL